MVGNMDEEQTEAVCAVVGVLVGGLNSNEERGKHVWQKRFFIALHKSLESFVV